MKATLDWLDERAKDVSAILLGLMFASFVVQIVFRYVLNLPLGWTLEACLTTWLWAVFWGASFDLRDSDHVRFDVLYQMFPERGRRVLAFISSAAIALAFAASLPAAYDYVSFYKIKKSVTLGIPLNYVFSIYLLFAFSTVVQYALRCWRIASGGPFEAPAPSDPADLETREPV
ncbi:MAG: TRAP transporter small permease subunit [Alphaproteobacteria bacterium]|nr:TRAP transporter small permease subunit [Alphaproteobacteria bacterium]